MNEIAAKIALMDGVRGCAFFHKEQGIQVWDGDGSIAEGTLRELAIYLVKLQLLGGKNGLGIHASVFQFNNCTVIGVPYSAEVMVVMCCSEQCDMDALIKFVEMRRQTAAQRKSSIEVTQELDYSHYKGLADLGGDLTASMEMIIEEEDSEVMQPYYDQLYESLAELIGPLADYVAQESFRRWRRDGPAIPARIFDLVSLMADEIEDPVLAEEFLNRFDKM